MWCVCVYETDTRAIGKDGECGVENGRYTKKKSFCLDTAEWNNACVILCCTMRYTAFTSQTHTHTCTHMHSTAQASTRMGYSTDNALENEALAPFIQKPANGAKRTSQPYYAFIFIFL